MAESGWMHLTWNQAKGQTFRGFESLSLRHIPKRPAYFKRAFLLFAPCKRLKLSGHTIPLHLIHWSQWCSFRIPTVRSGILLLFSVQKIRWLPPVLSGTGLDAKQRNHNRDTPNKIHHPGFSWTLFIHHIWNRELLKKKEKKSWLIFNSLLTVTKVFSRY